MPGFNKERYKNDPEYRAKEQARAKEYYHRTKKLIGEKTGPKVRPLEERLWDKVQKADDDACWEWLGASGNKTRAPTISDGQGKNIVAYRALYELVYGPLPSSDIKVLHSCRNSWCMNPAHLYTGDKYDWARQLKITSITEEEAFQRKEHANKKGKEYYWNNRDARRLNTLRGQTKNKIKALGYLGGKCSRCDQTHPAALQFHHKDPATKTFSISTKELSSPKRYSWNTILKELDKCDILCASCHAIYHSGLTEDLINELKEEVLFND